jgi:hypothetical protein
MKLTKPGELRSFAAYPRCWADAEGGGAKMSNQQYAGVALSVVCLVGPAVSAAVGRTDATSTARQAPSVKLEGRKVSFVGTSLFSMKTTRWDGTVESSFMVYVVEPTPDQRSQRQYFAVDERKPVRISDAAKRIQAQTENRAVVVSGLLSSGAEVPAQRLDPSVTDASSKVTVPLLVEVVIEALPK